MVTFCNWPWTPALFARQLHTLYWLPSECSDAAAYCCKVYEFNATDSVFAREEAHKKNSIIWELVMETIH